MVNDHTDKEHSNRFSRGEIYFLVGVVLLALVLRIIYHIEMRGHILVDQLQLDEMFHHRWAESIAAGDVIGEEVFFRAPLYPYLLGVLYAVFGSEPEIIRVLQHLAGVVLVVLIYILGRSLFGIIPAVLASLLCAMYGVFIVFEGRLLFDFPVTFLVFLWLTLVVIAGGKPSLSWKWFGLFGFLFGLICIMRPPFLAVALPVFGYLVWEFRKTKQNFLSSVAALLITFALPILIVTIRNIVIGGDFVLIASQGGINFYIGNNPHSDGMTSSVPEAGEVFWENRHVQFIAERELGHPLSPSEVSAYWYKKAWEFIRDQPLAFFALTMKKFYLFWSHIEIANNLSYYWFERASSVVRTLPVGFWLVGSLGLAGVVFAWRDRRARLPILFIVVYCVVVVAFFITDRFRLPVVPLLCVFSGLAVHRILLLAKERHWSSLVGVGVVLVIGAFVVNSNLARIKPDVGSGEKGMEARAALESGDYGRAAELLEQVVAADPHNAAGYINLGVARWKNGKMREAADAFRAGIKSNPYLAFLNLAHLHYTLQQMDSASVYAQRAIEVRPYAPGGYVIAAKISLVQQDIHRAENVLQQGLQACGDDFVYGRYMLAGIYFQNGNLAAADSLYRSVLHQTAKERQPRYAVESEKAQFGEALSTLYAKALYAIGRVYAAYQKLDSSEVYLRSAARLLPAKADVWGDWGVCLLRLNRLEEADTVTTTALAIEPNNPVIWFNYGTVMARKGEWMRAREALSVALALKPDFAEARDFLSMLPQKE